MQTITTPNGKRVSLGAYVRAIRRCYDNPAEMFRGWEWYPVSGEQVIADFGRMVTDHCNRGLRIPAQVGMKAAYRRYAVGVQAHCRSCGAPFLRHNPNNENDRYCSASCRAA